MTTHIVEPFSGKAGEVAKDFMRSFNRAMSEKSDEHKAKHFENYLKAYSPADKWFMALKERSKWAEIEKAFYEKWPAQEAAEKTVGEFEEELLALVLKGEDLGKKVEIGGVEVYTHVAWADQMAKLAEGAGVSMGPIYISQVTKNLPQVMRTKVAGTYRAWSEFLAAVKAVDIAYLKVAAEQSSEIEELKARLRMLESRPVQAATALNQQMAALNVSGVSTPQAGGARSTPPNGSSTQRRVAPPNMGPRPQPQIVTPELQAKVKASLVAMKQHPDTPEGRLAHREQQLEWAKKHGATTWVTEDTPYPLRPGTMPVCSGECYRCGTLGHRAMECPVPKESQLIQKEQAWRAVCARVLGNQTTVNVQWVATSDYGTGEEVTVAGVGQGNGEGLSA